MSFLKLHLPGLKAKDAKETQVKPIETKSRDEKIRATADFSDSPLDSSVTTLESITSKLDITEPTLKSPISPQSPISQPSINKTSPLSIPLTLYSTLDLTLPSTLYLDLRTTSHQRIRNSIHITLPPVWLTRLRKGVGSFTINKVIHDPDVKKDFEEKLAQGYYKMIVVVGDDEGLHMIEEGKEGMRDESVAGLICEAMLKDQRCVSGEWNVIRGMYFFQTSSHRVYT